MKKYILGIITGFFICLSITIGASILYNSKDIEFTPNDENWNVDNLQDAVDDLYKYHNEELSVTIYGAVNETISVDGVAKYTTGSNGQIGGTITRGQHVLYGSVSKQSFTIEVTDNTKEIYAMPENTIYWYGTKFDNFTTVIWSGTQGNFSFTENLNNIRINGNAGYGSGYYATQTESSYNKFNKAYIRMSNFQNTVGSYGLCLNESKFTSNNIGYCITDSSAEGLHVYDISSLSTKNTKYMAIYNGYYSANISEIYFE